MKLHPDVRELLDGSGLDWELVDGGRHLKLRVGGRLVQVLPKGKTALRPDRRAHLNCLTSIRRALRGLSDGRP